MSESGYIGPLLDFRRHYTPEMQQAFTDEIERCLDVGRAFGIYTTAVGVGLLPREVLTRVGECYIDAMLFMCCFSVSCRLDNIEDVQEVTRHEIAHYLDAVEHWRGNLFRRRAGKPIEKHGDDHGPSWVAWGLRLGLRDTSPCSSIKVKFLDGEILGDEIVMACICGANSKATKRQLKELMDWGGGMCTACRSVVPMSELRAYWRRLTETLQQRKVS